MPISPKSSNPPESPISSAAPISSGSIAAAAERIAPYVRRTPVLGLEPGAIDAAGRLVLKLDHLQPSGTFKARGAFNLLLSRQPETVAAASGGNFALAIAHAANVLGVAAHLFVPASAPVEKIERLQRSGASVRLVDGVYRDALIASREFAEATGALLTHAYDQYEVVEGAATCGAEILEQVPDVDTLLVAVGGGGLIGGISSAVRGAAKVIGVETEATPTLFAARAAGHPVDVEVGGIAASSLGATRLGEIAWRAAQNWVTDSVLVSDDATRDAQRLLWDTCRLVVEPGAATTVAALLTGAYRPAPNETVVAVICGANVDPTTI